MRVEIITIGNELLTGHIIDTNSSWLAQQLNISGVQVSRISSVSDSREDILRILNETGNRSDIVIITGGLGPTSDDVTKPVLCEFFNTRLVFRPDILEHVKSILKKRACEINEHNRRQAEVPESAIILQNDEGTNLQRTYMSNNYLNYKSLKKIMGVEGPKFNEVLLDFLGKLRKFHQDVRMGENVNAWLKKTSFLDK